MAEKVQKSDLIVENEKVQKSDLIVEEKKMLKCNKFSSHFCHVRSETIVFIGFWHIFCVLLLLITKSSPFIQTLSLSFANIFFLMYHPSLKYFNLILFLSAIFMIYGAIYRKPSFLRLFFFIQVFNFQMICLIMIFILSSIFNNSDIFDPFQEFGIRKDLFLLFIFILLVIKFYLICIVSHFHDQQMKMMYNPTYSPF